MALTITAREVAAGPCPPAKARAELDPWRGDGHALLTEIASMTKHKKLPSIPSSSKPRGASAAAPRSSSDPPHAAREPRGARRKRETRARLIEAAFQLMATRGMDAVAIAEITEAADVGAGSFYNHFESKEAIYMAVTDAVFEEFANTLDTLVKNLNDPAEVIAVCVRHTIRRAGREPVWGQFLIREGLSGRAVTRGLGQRLWRDIELGIKAGRLKVADPVMTYLAIGGAVLSAVSVELQLHDPASLLAVLAKQMGLKAADIPERCAAVLLHALGLSVDQSEKIVRRTLPEVPMATRY